MNQRNHYTMKFYFSIENSGKGANSIHADRKLLSFSDQGHCHTILQRGQFLGKRFGRPVRHFNHDPRLSLRSAAPTCDRVLFFAAPSGGVLSLSKNRSLFKQAPPSAWTKRECHCFFYFRLWLRYHRVGLHLHTRHEKRAYHCLRPAQHRGPLLGPGRHHPLLCIFAQY